MLSYWHILLALTLLQLLAAIVFLFLVRSLWRTPTGLRLVIVAFIFVIQSVLALVIYNKWRVSGYGPDASLPLIWLQTLTLIGTLTLVDIVRR